MTNRVVGVIRFPRPTMESLMARPRWAGVLLLTFLVTAGGRIGLMSTEVGRQALTDQWVQRAEAFGREVNDDLYAQFERLGERGPQVATITSVATGPLLAGLLAGALLVIARRAAKPRSYRQALAVVVHANLILAIRDLVAAPVNYAREALGSPLTPVTLFPMLDEASFGARFLGVIDLFIVWWLVVLAIGTAVLAGRPVRAFIVTNLGLYGVFALVMAAVMVLVGPY